jgi:hypothetical protein
MARPDTDNVSAGTQSGKCSSGVAVADLARAKKLPTDFLRSLGVEDKRTGIARREVTIPYYPPEGGAPVAVRRRTALRAKDGSLWAASSTVIPYGCWRLDYASRAGHLYLAEGESNCWCGWFRHLPVLGVPGASMANKLQPEHVEGVRTIYVVEDPDAGGASLVEDVARRLAELRWHDARPDDELPDLPGRAFAIRLPGVKDLADLHVRHVDDDAGFLDALRRAVLDAEPLTQKYLADNAVRDLRRCWPAARAAVARLLAVDLRRANDDALDDAEAEALADDLGPLLNTIELHGRAPA